MKSLFLAAASLLVSIGAFGQSFTTQSYPAGSGPGQLIVADFNGDHIPDLATVNPNSNTVSILINNGDGTFRPHMEFATGPSPVGLAAVDLNKDGKMDLVVANSQADAAHSVSILIGNGDGTFQTHQDIPGAPKANSIAVGDFNHDGNPDIATSSNSPVNAVYVSLGDGKGGFTAQKITSGFGQQPQPGESPYLLSKIVWADFNRDGKDDLYYMQCCGGFDVIFGAWGVLIGNGDGTFTDHLVDHFSAPVDLNSTDINQDGLSDVIISYAGCHTPCDGVLAEINNGNGTFTTKANIIFADNTAAGVAFPVQSDGLKDFVAVGTNISGGDGSDPNKTALYISHQNADGTFGNSTFVELAAPPDFSTLAVTADFNHDGKIDVAFANGTNVYVVLNTTPASPCLQRTTDHTVTLCKPSDGAVGLSPTHIVSHATSSTPVNASQIYLDFKLVFQVSGGNIDTNLPLTPGNHRLEVKSWSNGASFPNDFFLSTIASSGGNPPPCTDTVNFTVNICAPGQNANVNSPVNVVAAAKSSVNITSMQIYVDGTLVFHQPNVSAINTDVPMSKGAHRLTVKTWDSSGRNFSSTRNITVQ
ncbi:MAG TPA: FG-GAP-like repeat-containing protein [Candidatus Angelobacter sp.]